MESRLRGIGLVDGKRILIGEGSGELDFAAGAMLMPCSVALSSQHRKEKERTKRSFRVVQWGRRSNSDDYTLEGQR
jgi:hypothetical protein